MNCLDTNNNALLNTESANKGFERHHRLASPIIHNYTNYRQYLKDYYEYKKHARGTFSHRRFAQLSGIRSSNYLHLIMNSKRNLSVDLAYKVADAMALSPDEAHYFISLVKNGSNANVKSKSRDSAKKITLKSMHSEDIIATALEQF